MEGYKIQTEAIKLRERLATKFKLAGLEGLLDEPGPGLRRFVGEDWTVAAHIKSGEGNLDQVRASIGHVEGAENVRLYFDNVLVEDSPGNPVAENKAA